MGNQLAFYFVRPVQSAYKKLKQALKFCAEAIFGKKRKVFY